MLQQSWRFHSGLFNCFGGEKNRLKEEYVLRDGGGGAGEEWGGAACAQRLFAHVKIFVNPLHVELNPICHLLALLGAHHILHISRIRVKLRVRCGAETYFHLPVKFLFSLNRFQPKFGNVDSFFFSKTLSVSIPPHCIWQFVICHTQTDTAKLTAPFFSQVPAVNSLKQWVKA